MSVFALNLAANGKEPVFPACIARDLHKINGALYYLAHFVEKVFSQVIATVRTSTSIERHPHSLPATARWPLWLRTLAKLRPVASAGTGTGTGNKPEERV
jgi:hypothetical protein